MRSKFLQTLIVILIFVLASYPVRADWGIRMLAFKCDAEQDTLIIQPFIQWNQNYLYQGLELTPPSKKNPQYITPYTFFSLESFTGRILKMECEGKSRRVKIFLDANVLTIIDIKENNSWAKEIDFNKRSNSAWKVFGPLYQIRSNGFGRWEECEARGDVATIDTKYKCTSLKPLQ